MIKAREINQIMQRTEGASTVLVRTICSECGYSVITVISLDRMRALGASTTGVIDEHLAQHNEPDRAPDIEIDWTPDASCSICDDGGNIEINDIETVVCRQCNTTWTLDGTDGEIND